MEKKEQILIVDDELGIHTLFRDVLRNKNYTLFSATTGEDGLTMARQLDPSVVLLDLNLPGMHGMDVLRNIRETNPDIVIIIMTGYGTVENAVKAMKMGAFDFLSKPFRIDEFVTTLDRAVAKRAAAKEPAHAPSLQTEEKGAFVSIVGQSLPMKKVYETVQKVAQSSATVLIQGESGTGKELVARAIHYRSSRADKPFIAFNCAALPDGLLESELFGYEKGSFTGAFARKEGKFELANNGTILLDEISELNPLLQAKLLRVLQEKEVDPIGGKKPLKVDVRIIATTNQSLEKMIEEKKFREDLYYRLNVVSIPMPPLRERKEDIGLLAEHFLKKFNRLNNKNMLETADETMRLLSEYSWPGNVRELEHVMEMAVVMGEGTVFMPEFLPLNICSYASRRKEKEKLTFEIGTSVEEMERQLLLATLQKTGGNKEQAAQMLKISMKSLGSKISKYKLLDDDVRFAG